LLRAEASVAAQFAAKVRLVRIANFGRDACPVHTRLSGVRSQEQCVFRSRKPLQCPRGPTSHRAHLSFKLAPAPPFRKYTSSRYGASRPLAVSSGRSPRCRLMARSSRAPTRLQEHLDSLHTVFIGRRVEYIKRHGLPRIVQRGRERTYAVQVAIHADPCQPPKRISGEEQNEHVKRTAMPDHNRPRLRSTEDNARMHRLLVRHANSGPLKKPAEATTRSRRKAAQMLAIRWYFHAADNNATNTRFQCSVRHEPSPRCRVAARILATHRCRNRSIRLRRHLRLCARRDRTMGCRCLQSSPAQLPWQWPSRRPSPLHNRCRTRA